MELKREIERMAKRLSADMESVIKEQGDAEKRVPIEIMAINALCNAAKTIKELDG